MHSRHQIRPEVYLPRSIEALFAVALAYLVCFLSFGHICLTVLCHLSSLVLLLKMHKNLSFSVWRFSSLLLLHSLFFVSSLHHYWTRLSSLTTTLLLTLSAVVSAVEHRPTSLSNGLCRFFFGILVTSILFLLISNCSISIHLISFNFIFPLSMMSLFGGITILLTNIDNLTVLFLFLHFAAKMIIISPCGFSDNTVHLLESTSAVLIHLDLQRSCYASSKLQS
ncbi:hypothetical protein GEMRC1_002917 [Eukaryota sp. GEM-RC1]